MYFNDFLNDAFKTISDRDNSHKSISTKILPLKKELSPNKVENFVSKIEKKEFSCKIAGVDSGFVSRKLSSVEVALIRLGGVIFSYNNSVLENAEYFPSPVMLPEPVLLKSGLEKDEEQQSVSLERLRKEVSLSIEIIQKFKPRYLFIDGSIVPQYQDKPREGSKIKDDYNSIINLFQNFYKTAEENNCILISTIEDSRGTRFVQMLEQLPNPITNNLNGLSDASLLDHFLLEKERTFCFSYTKNISLHAILKDYQKDWAESIFVFYLRASNYDKPLRVEFICKDKNKIHEIADEIASITYSLSSLHREYSYPSVLIEADLRARLNEQDISMVYDKLIDKLGPRVMMRRNSRPFK